MSQTQAKTTPFQDAVYKATTRIPRGKVTTYKHLARAIGCASPRAVGQALRCNPFAPRVPCHRVISSSLTIGGFMGKTSGSKISKKLSLLREEGVDFSEGKLSDLKRLYTF